MTARYHITERDYIRAMRLFSRPAGWRLAFMAAMVLGLAACVVFGPQPLRAIGIGGLAGALVIWTASYGLVPLVARRHYRRYPAMQQAFAIELLETGVRFTSLHGEGALVWKHVLKWRQNDEYVLIYPMPRLFHIVPKALGAQGFDIDALTARLGEHVGQAS